MPNKDPELARHRKQEWYMQNRETILKRKQQRRAERKKQLPRAKPPPLSPEQIARTRELNRQARHQ